jgi:hypothetical protein
MDIEVAFKTISSKESMIRKRQLTNFMHLSPSGEAANCTATQEPPNMTHEDSLCCSQDPTSGPYFEPDQPRQSYTSKMRFSGNATPMSRNM